MQKLTCTIVNHKYKCKYLFNDKYIGLQLNLFNVQFFNNFKCHKSLFLFYLTCPGAVHVEGSFQFDLTFVCSAICGWVGKVSDFKLLSRHHLEFDTQHGRSLNYVMWEPCPDFWYSFLFLIWLSIPNFCF
jgi:hypothetical protein